MKLPAITRPNGAVYRPRTLTSRMLGDEDETNGVVVFGTHDVEEAARVARLDVQAMNREIGYHDEGERYVLDEITGSPVWWRQELAFFDEFNQARYYYAVDEEKGRAGVRFELLLVEEGQ